MKLIHTLKLIPLLVVLVSGVANAEWTPPIEDRIAYLEPLAEEGNADAQYKLGEVMRGERNFKDALKCLRSYRFMP